MSYATLLRAQLEAKTERRSAITAELDALAVDVELRDTKITTDEEAVVAEKLLGEAVALKTEEDALRSRIAEMDTVAVARESSVKRAIVPGATPGTSDPFEGDVRRLDRTEVATRARRALEQSNRLSAAQKEFVAARMADEKVNRGGAMERHLLATGSDDYRSAIGKLIARPSFPNLTDGEQRAMTIGTDPTGGFLMPFTLDPTLIDINAGVANPIRALAKIRTTMTDNWQGVTSAGVTASWDAEASEVSDDAPTLAQPSIPIRHPRAFVPFSIEADDDFGSLLGDLTVEASRAKDRLESAGFATGAGTGAIPQGIVTGLVAAAKIVTSAVTDTYAVADLYSAQGALPDRYDDTASWLMNKTVINLTRQFATANNHALLTQLADGTPPMLLGAALARWSSIDGVINATQENYVAIYGDIAETYTIVDRLGMTLELIPHLFAIANNLPSGQRGLYVRWRVGAGVVNADAARVLNVT